MHPEFSVVITSAGTSKVLPNIIQRCLEFSDDIIIISNDQAFVKQQQKCFVEGVTYKFNPFKGYGAQKNYGGSLARYEWIVNFDDDEIPSYELVTFLKQWPKLDMPSKVLRVQRINFCHGSPISWGAWQEDFQYRVYLKEYQWNNPPIHETLEVKKADVQKISLPIFHLTANHIAPFLKKTRAYRNKREGLSPKGYGKTCRLLKSLTNSLIRLEWLEGSNGIYLSLIRCIERV